MESGDTLVYTASAKAQEEDSSASDSDHESVAIEKADEEEEKLENPQNVPGDKFTRESELMEMLFGNKDQLIERMKDAADPPTTSQDKQAAKRKAVWRDSDDEEVNVDEGMKSSHVRRYLQDPERKYKQHLTQNFQKIVGEPKWAQLDRDQSDSDSDTEPLKHVGHVLGASQGALMRNTLDYRRRRDLNKGTSIEGPRINCVEFHPNSCVALVAGTSGVASLFSVEAKQCDKLHSICFKKYPITCARFNRTGEEVIFGGLKKFIHTFDLLSGQTRRILLPTDEMTRMTRFEISPNGEIIAVVGRFGYIHLLNGKTKEWMTTMKQEHVASSLTFSTDSQLLYTHSVDNEVNVFDLRKNRACHRFIDDGCITGRTISLSPNGKLLATGSAEGIVNIYDAEVVQKSKFPQPIKVISNLATGITMTRFNPTSEILGLCSADSLDGIKLAHFPSGSVFANFPLSTKSFGHPTTIAFSPGGRYMGVGTIHHHVPLFEMKHFGYF